MKKKFNSMWRVAIALVMVLSLGLVMAVPVAADVTKADVTVDPDTAEAAAKYTVEFSTTQYLLGGTGEITIEFPSDTTVPAGYDGTVKVDGITATTIVVDGQKVTITVPLDVSPAPVTVVLDKDGANDITNPATADDYTLKVSTSVETTQIASNAYTITPIADSTAPTVTLNAPNGAETWAGGDTKSIIWDADDNVDTALTIQLEYSADGGGSWSPIITLTDTLLSGYSWTVPSVDSIQCKVKVTATDDAANSDSDVSNAVFTIDSTLPTVAVTAPNGGEVWEEGTSHDITWTASDDDLVYASIAIDYSTDGGATWTRVASTEDNDGTYTWSTLPAVYSTQSLVKVTATDVAGNSGSDVSNAVFTIDDTTAPAAVILASPVGTENWAAGSTQSITWSGGGDDVDKATTIKLEYSADAGSSWNDVTTLANTANTSYSWVIPSIDSANCLVKVTATDDAGNSVSDVSAAVFTIAAATEVWVDDDGNDFYPGTEALPFKTIDKGITEAGVDGTVNVLPGTYEPGATLTIDKAGLTLQSTGTAAETIIDPSAGDPAIRITGDNVTVDGFTIKPFSVFGISVWGSDGAIVHGNTITSESFIVGIVSENNATNTTISENRLENANIYLTAGSNTVLGNAISGSLITDGGITLQGGSDGNIITGNTISGVSAGEGILFHPGAPGTVDDTLIQGNTISNSGNGIEVGADFTVTELVITGNTITDNGLVGILIDSGVTWGVGNAINNNNISGNLEYGIDNNITGTIIDAESNWWGDDSGPYQVDTNPSGTGDEVTADVDYGPWLLAPYAEPVEPVTIIELSEGWNLISLMLMPTDPAIEVVLSGVTVDSVHYYDASILDPNLRWSSYVPGEPSDLETMGDGKGFWVEMSADETLAVLGNELPDPPATPPTYDVVVGWNLIGFKSTTTRIADSYLAAIDGQYTMIYGFADGVYFVVQETDELNPGKGYWIAITEAGTIYP